MPLLIVPAWPADPLAFGSIDAGRVETADRVQTPTPLTEGRGTLPHGEAMAAAGRKWAQHTPHMSRDGSAAALTAQVGGLPQSRAEGKSPLNGLMSGEEIGGTLEDNA
jgi:hypothetical protein